MTLPPTAPRLSPGKLVFGENVAKPSELQVVFQSTILKILGWNWFDPKESGHLKKLY